MSTSKIPFAASRKVAQDFVDFVNKAVTPFHAVATVEELLVNNGYKKISELHPWPELEKGGKYFVTRNGSSLVAFAIGGKFEPANGFKIVGGHTDSPNFQLKPKSHVKKGVFHGVAVQCYGGGLWHTWFDRELTVAGRLIIQSDGLPQLKSRLVHITKPILRIPSLAIHLRSQAERDAFAPNKETHLLPLLATEQALADLELPQGTEQSPLLMKLLAEQAECKPEEIVDFDLSVIDHQPALIGGALDEFVFAPRIDNLASCFCSIRALLNADATVAEDSMVRVVALFDHEEVGSESPQGAAGTLITDIFERICAAQLPCRAASIANSFLLSVDCAHAAHPNYGDKHEDNHRPHLHLGPVVKYNVNTKYATNGLTGSVVKAISKLAGVPVQQFCVRNDSPCGSTIGPILSTLSGIPAADIGNPMLSMHSVRETCGTVDLHYLTVFLESFFTSYQIVRPVEN